MIDGHFSRCCARLHHCYSVGSVWRNSISSIMIELSLKGIHKHFLIVYVYEYAAKFVLDINFIMMIMIIILFLTDHAST
jgi:hypothetical protein